MSETEVYGGHRAIDDDSLPTPPIVHAEVQFGTNGAGQRVFRKIYATSWEVVPGR